MGSGVRIHSTNAGPCGNENMSRGFKTALVCIALVLLLPALGATIWIYWPAAESLTMSLCRHCGAERREYRRSFFGVTYRDEVAVRSTAASRWIADTLPAPCRHSWMLAKWGASCRRVSADGTGKAEAAALLADWEPVVSALRTFALSQSAGPSEVWATFVDVTAAMSTNQNEKSVLDQIQGDFTALPVGMTNHPSALENRKERKIENSTGASSELQPTK